MPFFYAYFTAIPIVRQALRDIHLFAIIAKGTDRRSGNSAPERGDLYGDLRVFNISRCVYRLSLIR